MKTLMLTEIDREGNTYLWEVTDELGYVSDSGENDYDSIMSFFDDGDGYEVRIKRLYD